MNVMVIITKSQIVQETTRSTKVDTTIPIRTHLLVDIPQSFATVTNHAPFKRVISIPTRYISQKSKSVSLNLL